MHPTLLLVDDNEEILVFLKDDLEEHYAIFTAGSGTEALEVLNTEVIQLVVSDVMMPDMDGFELCSHIKNNVEYCHIPVILLTAKNTLQAKIEGLEIFVLRLPVHQDVEFEFKKVRYAPNAAAGR